MKVYKKIELSDLKPFKSGKVRELFEAGKNYVMVATDRLSAFDVIMNQGIPNKGIILTQISLFWFEYTKDIVKNHLISSRIEDFPDAFKKYKEVFENRSMLVQRTSVIPIECIVRGYISGSGWNDYKSTGEISGIKLPRGLKESDKLPEPIFTPSTKAEIGDHDENISLQKATEIAGKETVEKIKEYSLKIYKKCSDFALEKGIIIADTKMEFGITGSGEIILIDEVLTPDSSRFWSLENYSPGVAQNSFDKQFVRDYLLKTGFNKKPPAPDLPNDIILKTSEKYIQAYSYLTGKKLL
ncbi:MAG: phosphoribosylaminoimidazolesuccinocarboxamide synthase [Ignavibacteriaceae bacterium]|nr:phosphoribosylaminoimidazolesuccinocarboxamide synthase [Ignavibacteriaceae bacterium]